MSLKSIWMSGISPTLYCRSKLIYSFCSCW